MDKLCITCKHAVRLVGGPDNHDTSYACQHPIQGVNPVTGAPVATPCAFRRRSPGSLCGPSGSLWEPRKRPTFCRACVHFPHDIEYIPRLNRSGMWSYRCAKQDRIIVVSSPTGGCPHAQLPVPSETPKGVKQTL